MVHIHDVVPGDIVHICGDEADPIIQEIKRDGQLTKFVYRPGARHPEIKETFWMDPNTSNGCFIHDLKGERFLYEESAQSI